MNFKKEKKWFEYIPGTAWPAVTLNKNLLLGYKIIYRDHLGNVCIDWVSKNSLFPRD